MNNKQKLHQIKLTQWASRFQEQAASGLTVKAWCAENNVTIHTYNYWNVGLAKGASRHSLRAPRARTPRGERQYEIVLYNPTHPSFLIPQYHTQQNQNNHLSMLHNSYSHCCNTLCPQCLAVYNMRQQN